MKSRMRLKWCGGIGILAAVFVAFVRRVFVCADVRAARSAQPPDAAAAAKPQAPQPTRGQSLAGTWAGSLKAGDNVLHFVLHIGVTEYGVAVATIDSLDQGVYGIEAGSLKEAGATFQFDIPSVNAAFEG